MAKRKIIYEESEDNDIEVRVNKPRVIPPGLQQSLMELACDALSVLGKVMGANWFKCGNSNNNRSSGQNARRELILLPREKTLIPWHHPLRTLANAALAQGRLALMGKSYPRPKISKLQPLCGPNLYWRPLANNVALEYQTLSLNRRATHELPLVLDSLEHIHNPCPRVLYHPCRVLLCYSPTMEEAQLRQPLISRLSALPRVSDTVPSSTTLLPNIPQYPHMLT
ncbi:hypothetical protein JVT61DRAFT_3717 [Boletus reticuloceps]|uniref:Uncharacterized protein n=1 Tax=Boletus reticuloceps TaxID=495285 RepID=A0A8I3A9X1_9AGAM|nr:hypothetical protein JVT61DRAFT_3717 [Boletus reticuloceps]